jgi:hypothetical protein
MVLIASAVAVKLELLTVTEHDSSFFQPR